MLRLLEEPLKGRLGRVIIAQTGSVSEIERRIREIGFEPADAQDLMPKHSENTRYMIIAIGSTVNDPVHNQPSYKGFDKNGGNVHILKREGSIQPNIEIAVKIKKIA
jgi:hypothetical protein